MRKFILIICGLQLAFCLAYVIAGFTTSSDAAGRGMAAGFALVAAVVTGIFVVPATLLAWFDKALNVALVLALVVPALIVILNIMQ